MTQLTIPDAELDVLQWAERCAEGAQKQLLESAKILADQASTTMTLLLAGIGGAMGLSVKLFESAPFTASATPPTPTSIGASFVCVYLVILAVLLLRNCIAVGPIPLTYNEPAHLVQAGWTLKQLLPVELEHRQTTINALKLRNKVRGAWLNRIRLAAAVGAPLAFLVGALCAR